MTPCEHPPAYPFGQPPPDLPPPPPRPQAALLLPLKRDSVPQDFVNNQADHGDFEWQQQDIPVPSGSGTGPFFHRLGKMLRRSGASVWRVGFNAGDRVFWPDRATYIPFTAPPETWPDRFDKIVADKGITDIVLYGDVRDIHATAIQRARDLGLMVHVFEEGYLRPYWVTV